MSIISKTVQHFFSKKDQFCGCFDVKRFFFSGQFFTNSKHQIAFVHLSLDVTRRKSFIRVKIHSMFNSETGIWPKVMIL